MRLLFPDKTKETFGTAWYFSFHTKTDENHSSDPKGIFVPSYKKHTAIRLIRARRTWHIGSRIIDFFENYHAQKRHFQGNTKDDRYSCLSLKPRPKRVKRCEESWWRHFNLPQEYPIIPEPSFRFVRTSEHVTRSFSRILRLLHARWQRPKNEMFS